MNWSKGDVVRQVARLAGYRFERLGPRSLALIDVTRPDDGWFILDSLLERLLEDFGIDLVIDVGANEGQFGKRMRRIYAGDMISFEPVSDAFAGLRLAAASDARWKTVQCALGSADTRAVINVTSHSVFSSLLPPNSYAASAFGAAQLDTHDEEIEVRRLDRMLAEHYVDVGRRSMFLKMDTQGYDRQVFAGAGSLTHNIGVLQSEVSCRALYESMPHWTDAVALYEKSGFGIAGLFPVSRDNHLVIEYDCVMVSDRPKVR